MRTKTVVVLVALALTLPISSWAAAEQNYEIEYIGAVAKYYDADLSAVQSAVESGIPVEELPVVFFVANSSKTDAMEVVKTRTSGASFQQIVEKYGLSPLSFTMIVNEDIKSDDMKKTFSKIKGKTRKEIRESKFDDVDFVRLENFRFLFSHYNYSPHIILGWLCEGKTFVQVNRQTFVVTSEMNAKRLADNK